MENVDPSFDDLEKGFQTFPLDKADTRAVGDIGFFNDWVTHPEQDEYWLAIDGTDRPNCIYRIGQVPRCHEPKAAMGKPGE